MKTADVIQVEPTVDERKPMGRLMVAYDFSAFAEIALQYAVQFAQSFGGEIQVVYVESPLDVAAEEDGLAAMKSGHDQATYDIESVAARLRERGIPASAICRLGTPADVLVELAVEFHPDILFIGAYGHKREDSHRLGSTAEFLMRCLPCATLTVGPQAAFSARSVGSIQSIIFASSAPSHSGHAFCVVTNLARGSKSRVEMVHVIDSTLAIREHRSEKEIDKTGRALVDQLTRTGIEAHWKMCSGSTSEELVRQAIEHHADLIVFGIEHHTANSGIVGAINDTVQKALCPVLTVPGVA